MRIMKLLGVSVAIITNAAGGLDPQMEVGTIVALQDHISLPSLASHALHLATLDLLADRRRFEQTSMNPLIGRNRDTLGPRFPPMSDGELLPLK